jgi:hypothetical protein
MPKMVAQRVTVAGLRAVSSCIHEEAFGLSRRRLRSGSGKFASEGLEDIALLAASGGTCIGEIGDNLRSGMSQ